MRKNVLLGCAGLLFLNVACTPVLTTTNSTAKSTDIISTGVYHSPVVADLKVSEEKIKAEVTSDDYDSKIEYLKQKAIAKALISVSGDVLVEPKYQVETVGNRKTVTVTGYPATYRNFRNASETDSNFLVVENENTINTQEISEKDGQKKTSTGKAVLLSMIGLGSALALLLIL